MKNTAKKTAKSTKSAATSTHKSSIFMLAAKAKTADFGEGQRAAIAKALGKDGATRAKLIHLLPSVPPANISWHLSMMVAAKLVKKAA